MNLRPLATYSFDKNVGTVDRVFRIGTGLGVAGVGWGLSLPVWAAIAVSVVGLAWVATGIVSKCGMYYLAGHSSRRDGRH